jgi:hypothetical protein
MIIDTNVIVSVDDTDPVAKPHCVVRCQEVIAESRNSVVALDDDDLIITEYLKNVSHRYPFAVGAQFVMDLRLHRFDPERCELVHIVPNEHRGFEEFPVDPDLETFDRSDRKFVAVAIASVADHQIYNATDSDWAPVDVALGRFGVNVVYLCPSVTSPKR